MLVFRACKTVQTHLKQQTSFRAREREREIDSCFNNIIVIVASSHRECILPRLSTPRDSTRFQFAPSPNQMCMALVVSGDDESNHNDNFFVSREAINATTNGTHTGTRRRHIYRLIASITPCSIIINNCDEDDCWRLLASPTLLQYNVAVYGLMEGGELYYIHVLYIGVDVAHDTDGRDDRAA